MAAGGREVAGVGFDAVLEDEVPVAHDNGNSSRVRGGFNSAQRIGNAHAGLQSSIGRPLDDGTVHAGVGVRDADFDDVSAAAGQFCHRVEGAGNIGEADGQVAHEGGTPVVLGLCEDFSRAHTWTAPSSM